ncbi:MAG: HAMP domain-containing sensor histidine kinase [Anaerolineae bacterium]
MSIRLRLSLLYSLILAATLLGFSVMLYLTMERSTRAFMEETLAAEMQRLVDTNAQPLSFMQFPAEPIGSSQTYWQACDAEGNVMGRTDNLHEHILPLSDDGLHQVQSGQSIYEVTRINDIPLLVFSKPVVSSEGTTTGILQVARSVAEQEQATSTLRTSLVFGSMFTLLLALVGGWGMAGFSLRPIDQMTRTAHMIGKERDFSRRVQYNGPQDEVGRLARTFNEMLFALETAYQQVAQALQAQRTFIADASHELRTPLTTLRGNLALLRREPPIAPEDRKAVLLDIVDENERMIRLVNDLMTLARADYTPGITLAPVDLPQLFTEIERQARSMHPACTFCVTRVADTEVIANRDMLKQVILILLDNAFKFTPKEGHVKLSARLRDGVVSIQVRDNGIGIGTDNLPHIFQRFYRASPSRQGQGYGLGLAIAKTLTEKQRGQIRADSETGKGSTFTVTLLACDREGAPVRQAAELPRLPAYSYANP